MEALQFKLPIFEGPLDVLLYLVQKHKLDLRDIPVGLITEQYLAYIDTMTQLDMEVTGEFLTMAAHLLYMKSKTLLPVEEEPEEEDPKEELQRRLAAYKAAKEAAGMLEKQQFSTLHNYFKTPEHIGRVPVENKEVPIEKLIDAFMLVAQRTQDKLPPPRAAFREIVEVQRISLADQIRYVAGRCAGKKKIPFPALFAELHTRDALVATFLAILHLVSRGKLTLSERGNTIYLQSKGESGSEGGN